MQIFLYLVLGLFVLLDLYLLFRFVEYYVSALFRHQPPFVPSIRKARKYVVNEIKSHYPHAKNVVEVGAGFGGLARMIARKCRVSVVALENMPFSATVSKFLDIITCANSNTYWADAFKFLDSYNEKFDIAVAYLGPDGTQRVAGYADKIGVLISVDFMVPGQTPVRTIRVNDGATYYKGKTWPHVIYVYEL